MSRSISCSDERVGQGAGKKPYQKPTLTEYGHQLDLTTLGRSTIEPRHRSRTSRIDGTTGSNIRVLVVEDDTLLLQILREGLRESGFDVATAGDGNEAFRVIPRFNPAVIVVDVVMAGEKGYRVCRAIKKLGRHGMDVPPKIVLLTSRSVDDDPEREVLFLRSSQADAMLYKPCKPAHLRDTITRLLATQGRKNEE